ncbi:unnamed protein product [Choristocarpus tenellus]
MDPPFGGPGRYRRQGDDRKDEEEEGRKPYLSPGFQASGYQGSGYQGSGFRGMGYHTSGYAIPTQYGFEPPSDVKYKKIPSGGGGVSGLSSTFSSMAFGVGSGTGGFVGRVPAGSPMLPPSGEGDVFQPSNEVRYRSIATESHVHRTSGASLHTGNVGGHRSFHSSEDVVHMSLANRAPDAVPMPAPLRHAGTWSGPIVPRKGPQGSSGMGVQKEYDSVQSVVTPSSGGPKEEGRPALTGPVTTFSNVLAEPLPPAPFCVEPSSHLYVSGVEPKALARIISSAMSENGADYDFSAQRCRWEVYKYSNGSFVEFRVVAYTTGGTSGTTGHGGVGEGNKLLVNFVLRQGDRFAFRGAFNNVVEAFRRGGLEVRPSKQTRVVPQPVVSTNQIRRVSMPPNLSRAGNANVLTPPQALSQPGAMSGYPVIPYPVVPYPSSIGWFRSAGPSMVNSQMVENVGSRNSLAGDDLDGVKPLVAMLTDRRVDTNLEGARMVARLSEGEENRSRLATAEVVSALSQVVMDTSPCQLPQARAFAVFALSNLSESDECHALIVKSGVLPRLLKLAAAVKVGQQETTAERGAGAADLEMRRECARTLANICPSHGKEVVRWCERGGDVALWLASADTLVDDRLRTHAVQMRRLLAVSDPGIISY